MNERIEKLGEQAKKYALDAMIKITDKEQTLKVYSEAYDTKFAELILKECTDVLMQRHEESKHSHNYYHVTANMLKNHFGVKE